MTTVPVISVIDDDASIRAAIYNLLRSLGYIVHVFASAEAFLQSPQQHNTWCVVADVRMPGMSGIDLQFRLRGEGSRVPFVFVTAVPEESIRARALEGGAICFLTKPFDEDSLVAGSRQGGGVVHRRNARLIARIAGWRRRLIPTF